jgi:antirestriction protein ArdC
VRPTLCLVEILFRCRLSPGSKANHFYNASFHELTYWSGHKLRLDRDLKNRFGSRNYAAEELIAELGAAFLCAEFGFDGDVRNAGYIASWIELLTADKRAFFTACSQASKAVDYLRGLTADCSVYSTDVTNMYGSRWKTIAGALRLCEV